jgi:alcohol dehydrogenase, propanol-preferring
MQGVQLHGGNTPPITGSHEAVGIIEAVGPEVSKFQPGDRVGTLNYYHLCGSLLSYSANEGTCKDCRSNDEGYVYCQREQKTLGITVDGCFSEFLLADSLSTFKLSDNLPMNDAAPLMCGGVTMYKALKRCNLIQGDTVGIMGCGGGLGHIGIQFAKSMGYNVVGIDAQDDALRIAESMNCLDLLIDARKTNKEEAVKEIARKLPTNISEEQGCAAIIVLTEAQVAFDYACKITQKHGIIMTVSVVILFDTLLT